MMKRKVGITFGVIVVVGVLVWGLAFGGFSIGTPVQPDNPNNGTNSTNGGTPTGLTGSSSIGVGKITVANYTVGEVTTSSLPVRNGRNVTVNYTISCRLPDRALEGYIKGPSSAVNWFQLEEESLTLEPGTEKIVSITFLIPEGTTDDELFVYFLTEEGVQYLDNARAETVSSEDSLAAAFKEELIGLPDLYEQFDDLYANREDKYVFRAIYDAFPQYYPELVVAWEAALVAVSSDLSAVPYASALAIIERLGSVSEVERGSYPELADLPEQYVGSSDLRDQPWEFWITVLEGSKEMIQIELACRWLVHMVG